MSALECEDGLYSGRQAVEPQQWPGAWDTTGPCRPVQELGTELASQAMAARHAGGSPSLLVALVIRLFSRRFRRRALRLLISST